MRVIKISRNGEGKITRLMLENGKIISYDEALVMAKRGRLKGIVAVWTEQGTQALSCKPEVTKMQSVFTLPEIND